MIEIIEQLPGPDQITPERFKECLESIRCWGADIKTAICILSVLREGQYPPLDWRIAKAARKKQVIDEKEEAALNGKNKRKIAEIYVEKLLPKWIAELDEVKDPKLLDNSWGALAISN